MKIKLNNIYQSDWLEFMEQMYDQNIFINTCFTSPPYFQLRDYKHPKQVGWEKTPDDYVNTLVEGYKLLHKVLTPDGSFFLNIGDTYAYKDLQMIPEQVAIALRKKVGYVLRNKIIWFKPNPMPSSVKDRWANSYEYVFFFTKKNTKGPFWWVLLNRPKTDPKKKNYENQLEKKRIWDEAIKWWGSSVIKPYAEVPEEYRIVGYKLSYYFALDLIRKPHKTESLEKYQRQINVGMKGGNKESKYFGTEHDGQLGGSRTAIPRWFLDEFGVDKNYKKTKKFENFEQTTLVETDPQKVVESLLDTPNSRQLQFNKEFRHKTKHKSASQKERAKMYHPKGASPIDVSKINENTTQTPMKKATLFAFLEGEKPKQKSPKNKKQSARSSESPSKYDGEYRGGMALPPQPTDEGAFHPLGKNPGDMMKHKDYEEWYDAANVPLTVKSKGHGDKASTVARLAAGLVENHPLGKNPGDIVKEIEIPSDIYELFLQWVEWQSFNEDVFEISTRSFKGSHFAVFPKAIVHDPVVATCPPNGVAFDPMCGRGTVGAVAFEHNFNFLLCDLNPKYVQMAKKYVKVGQRKLI